MASPSVRDGLRDPWDSTKRLTKQISDAETSTNSQLQLHRRTSIRIDSEPNMEPAEENSDRVSTISSLNTRDKRILRGFRLRLGSSPHGVEARASCVHESGISFESSEMGTTVIIEASHPLGKDSSSRRDMRGLDQAASMSRWIGNAKPPEPWGKLLKVSAKMIDLRKYLQLKQGTGSGALEPDRRHTHLLWLSTSRTLISAVILNHRRYEVPSPDFHAP